MIIDADRLEKIIIALIFLTLSVTFILKPGDKVEEEIVIDEDTYDTKTNNLVHEQSIVRHPGSDGKPRDFTWVWKLYKTERTRYIPPGEYEIVVGGLYEGGFGQLKMRIII